MLKIKVSIISIYIILSGISCINTKKATYFAELTDSEIRSDIENLEPVIQKNDLLSISVNSLNPEASLLFNTPNVSATQATTSTGGTTQASGYLVDEEGYIQFPMLGKIKSAGLTKKVLKEEITNKLIQKKLLAEPLVNIRFLNFKVTVLGEVNRATVVNVPNEKISLLEAIGLAGDITVFGKKDNVMIIREEEGKKIIKRINLNSYEIFKSPYYYLKSNDIVYVEANKSKVAAAGRGQQLLPIIFSGLSLTVTVLYFLTSRN